MSPTLVALIDRYARMRHLGGSPKSTEKYEVTIRKFSEFLDRPARLTDLTDERVAEFAVYRLKSGRKDTTVQNNMAKLLAFWRWAYQMRMVDHMPQIKKLKVPERVPTAWTREEIERLFVAASQTEGVVGLVPAEIWWEALLRLLWNTCDRLAAVMQLTWPDIDLVHGGVTIRADYRKGRTCDIYRKLQPATIAVLERFPYREGWVCRWPYSMKKLYPAFRSILVRAGLPVGRHDLFHKMRRSAATHIKAAGGDPTAALDHSSSRTTRAYIDPRICPEVQPADVLFSP